jgi:hypothetical protein
MMLLPLVAYGFGGMVVWAKVPDSYLPLVLSRPSGVDVGGW